MEDFLRGELKLGNPRAARAALAAQGFDDLGPSRLRPCPRAACNRRGREEAPLPPHARGHMTRNGDVRAQGT